MKRYLSTLTLTLALAAGAFATTQLALHGQADFVSIASPTSTGSSTTASVTAWVKYVGAENSYVIGNGDANEIRITGGALQAYFFNGSQLITATSPQTYGDGAWHFVAGVRNGTALTLYVDGASVASNSFSTNGAYPYQISAIGSRTASVPSGYYQGFIKDVRLYSTALTGGNVTTLYGGGTFTTGIVAKYLLNEGSGTSLADSSGNSKTATIQNPNSVYSSWIDADRLSPATHYVSTTGSISNTGADTSHTWPIGYALAAPPDVFPGDTIQVGDGTYSPTGPLVSTLTGTSGSRITVQTSHAAGAFPTTVKIDCVSTFSGAGVQGTCFTINGAYTTYNDLEVFNSNPQRVSTTGLSSPTDICTIGGIAVVGNGTILNHPHVHDNSRDGIYAFDPNGDITVNDALIYNNGWTGTDRTHAHGIYTHNTLSGHTLTWNDIISFNNYYYNFQHYASQYQFDSYNEVINGFHSANASGIGIVGAGPKHGFQLRHVDEYGSTIELGYSDEDNYDLIADDIYAYYGSGGPITSRSWRNLTLTNSVIVTDTASLNAGMAQVTETTGGVLGTNTIDNNAYYGGANPNLSQAFVRYNQDGSLDSYKTFAQWQALGYDAHSTFNYGSGAGNAYPSANVSRYYPDTVTSGRCAIAVWNWQNLSSVTLDLSHCTGLVNGQAYSIYNAMNPAGGTVTTGTYSSGAPTKSLTMTSNGVASRISDAGTTPADTLPRYGMFLLIPGAVNGSAPGQPTGLAASWDYNATISLTWTLGSGTPTSVTLERSTDQSTWTPITLGAAATSYSDTGRTKGVTYYYRVKATNASGDSLYSTTASKLTTGHKFFRVQHTIN